MFLCASNLQNKSSKMFRTSTRKVIQNQQLDSDTLNLEHLLFDKTHRKAFPCDSTT